MIVDLIRSVNEEWLDIFIALLTLLGFLCVVLILIILGALYFKVYDAVLLLINKRG